MTDLKTRSACDAFGVFVEDIDLRKVSADQLSAIRQLLFKNGVVFFRDQDFRPEDHIAFAEAMGAIEINRYFIPVAGYPQIAEVIKEADGDFVIGENWHTDHSYNKAPALGSILYALETPPVGGGTQFAGMQAAYDALDDRTKEQLSGLKARHESIHIFAPSEAERLNLADEEDDDARAERGKIYPEAVHPVILNHPETGRPGIYVNPEFTTGIEGMNKTESNALLQQIYDHILQPQFVYEFSWKPGSIAMWDNRSTWHKALDNYQGHRRHMHRITVEGVPLEAM